VPERNIDHRLHLATFNDVPPVGHVIRSIAEAETDSKSAIVAVNSAWCAFVYAADAVSTSENFLTTSRFCWAHSLRAKDAENRKRGAIQLVTGASALTFRGRSFRPCRVRSA
jgi:hypothetical protein